MALTSTTIATRDRALDAALDAHSRYLDLYDGAPPAALGAITTQTKAARVDLLSAMPFAAASGGSKTASGPFTGLGLANVAPTWARLVDSDGTTAVMDMTVGPTGNIVFANSVTNIVVGATVTISSFTVTQAQDA